MDPDRQPEELSNIVVDEETSGICRNSNPFDLNLQCAPRLRSKGLSRTAEVSSKTDGIYT